jgi:hypothetical protein
MIPHAVGVLTISNAFQVPGFHGRVIMAHIEIKDLKESVELDRAAMRQITGGWNRQCLSVKPRGYESILFQGEAAFDPLNLAGIDFNLNR